MEEKTKIKCSVFLHTPVLTVDCDVAVDMTAEFSKHFFHFQKFIIYNL